jgi:hypothetical protein
MSGYEQPQDPELFDFGCDDCDAWQLDDDIFDGPDSSLPTGMKLMQPTFTLSGPRAVAGCTMGRAVGAPDHKPIRPVTDPQRPYHPNKTPKGEGRDSKERNPDPWDNYRYEHGESPAFCLLQKLGYKGISLDNLCHVGNIVELEAERRALELEQRNRAAHRRKSCAFHWLDANWSHIRGIYESALNAVLGGGTGTKPRGRKPKVRSEGATCTNS